MTDRKSPNELPPQFARARRLREQAQPEAEVKKSKAVTKKQSIERSGFFAGFQSWFATKPSPKTTQPKPVEKKTVKKKLVKKTVKKPVRKGVIAAKADTDLDTKPKKSKPAPKKAKKKVVRPKKSAVKTPSATKVKKNEVHFSQMKVEMDTELENQLEAIEQKHEDTKAKTTVRKRVMPKAEVFPRLVKDAPEETGEPEVQVGIFGSQEEPKKAKGISLGWFKKTEKPQAQIEVSKQPKRSFWPFAKKKSVASQAPLQQVDRDIAGGAIAAMTARMEDGQESTEPLSLGDETVEDMEESVATEPASQADVEAEIARIESEMADMDTKTKKEQKHMAKQRTKELKELRKKAKEYAKQIEAEQEDEEEIETNKQKMIEVDQRIAEKEAQKKEKEMALEEQERRKAQANKDLDAMAQEMVRKKKKKGGGITGVLKSINNLGMGKYRVQFVQNLAMMLNAGLPLIDALQTLQVEIRNRAMRKVIARIAELVDSGHPLWRAMDEQYLFSPYEVALVRVGEEAGNLSRNMVYLADQQEKDHALKQKVKMAMIYPSIVMVLMFIVVMGLGLFVLPNLVQVLYSLNAELPATTRAVIFITDLFSKYGQQAVPLMMLGGIVLFLLAKYTPFRVVTQWMVFKIPGIGRLAREATIARFGVILGGLLEAGVPLVESLQSLEDVTHIVSYKKMYRQMTERVALGDSFAICFKDIRGSRKLIPPSMQQLIVTGERSGSLSETFLKVASIYEKKAEETAEKLPTILEPMLLLIIGGLVGTIAFAIITPIYSVVGNVGR